MSRSSGRVDISDTRAVAHGREVYMRECASCHGDQLQGQPNWQTPNANGALPAPPHDITGHTWHHADDVLFDIVKRSVTPFAPPGYRTDMPAYAGKLSDQDIWDVLSYIESTWPVRIADARAHHLSQGH